jgi:hypothetical protein
MSTKRPVRIALSSVLPILYALHALGCGGSSRSAGDEAGGGPVSDASGGASIGANGGTNGGASMRLNGGTNAGGAGASGSMNVARSSCELDLPTFEQNGYRTCEPNDSPARSGVCGPEFAFENGRTEVCGNFRLYAYGHDGRITCAYDSSTGNLVGGFLSGIPVQGKFCLSDTYGSSTYFAGPGELASCPAPTIPYCDNTDPGTGDGGARGSGGEGGAVDVWTEAGADGAP